MRINMDFPVMILVLFCLMNVSNSIDILYTAPRAIFNLASSASASASQATTPLLNIVNFSRRQEKAARLKEENGLTEQEDLLAENQDAGATNDSSVEEGSGGGTNEASPSLFQKKINKLVAKLNFIAQIKSAFHRSPDPSTEAPEQFETTTSTSETSKIKITFEDPVQNNSQTIRVSENIQQIPNTKYGIPKKVAEGPERIDLQVNEVTREVVEKIPKREEVTDEPVGGLDRIRLFFAQMVGRLVGWTYGAFGRL